MNRVISKHVMMRNPIKWWQPVKESVEVINPLTTPPTEYTENRS